MPNLLEKLIASILVAIALQGLNILAFSAVGQLPWCWIGSACILAAFIVAATRFWNAASTEERMPMTAAWSSPWPWLIIALLLAQIIFYPPTMHDSLSYRLPRIFLALQDGSIGRFETPDARMNGMPWGWESLALPFASLNVLGASKLINLGCWALAYQLLFSWALTGTSHVKKARWVALALASAPGFLLQASSTANDLYAATLLLAGVWMIRRFHQSPGSIPVMASLLALVLAANAKPQFLTLGAPWLIWWLIASGKPWKQTAWWTLALAAPFYLLVSPLPILAINYDLTGSLMGNDPVAMTAGKPSALLMMVAGTIQFLCSQFQLPVFPGAESFSAMLHRLSGFMGTDATLPASGPGIQLVPIVDRASFGLPHFLMILLGFMVFIRTSARYEWRWFVAAIFGFLIAASQVVPDTIGRSFMGFISLILPAAAIGLALMSERPLVMKACVIAVLCGLAALAINPSSPLWPSRQLQSLAKERGNHNLVAKLEKYHAYQRRAETGRGILGPVPPGESVSLLIRQITPVAYLWTPRWQSHRLEFIHATTPQDFASGSCNWLVIGDKAAEQFPEIFDSYRNLAGWEKVTEQTYLPNISQGPETWTLYKRKQLPPSASRRQH